MCAFCIPVFVLGLALHAVLPTPPISLRLYQFLSPEARTRRSSILRTLFQVPYPISPLLAILTKTAGVYTNKFPFWFTPSQASSLPAAVTRHRSPVYSSSFFSNCCALFCTHQKLNSFIFNRFRTLCQKTPGVGGDGCRRDLASTRTNSWKEAMGWAARSR